MADAEQPIRILFQNVLLEVHLNLEADPRPLETAVRSFARAHGVSDTERMTVSSISKPSGLVYIDCRAFRCPIEAAYKDPECQILDVLNEQDVKLLFKLSAQAGAEESPTPAPPAAAPLPDPAPAAESEAEGSGPDPGPPDLAGDRAQAPPLQLVLEAEALSADSFTLEVWVYPQHQGQQPVQPGKGLTWAVADEAPLLALDGRVLQGTESLSANSWHHLCWRYNHLDDELLAFVDGQPQVLASPWSKLPVVAPTGAICLGHWDQLSLSRSARRGKEIQDHSAQPPPSPPRVSAPKADQPDPPSSPETPAPAATTGAPSESPAPTASSAPDDVARDGAATPAAEPSAPSDNPVCAEQGSPVATASAPPVLGAEAGPRPDADRPDNAMPAPDGQPAAAPAREPDTAAATESVPTTAAPPESSGTTRDILFIGPDILSVAVPDGAWSEGSRCTGTLLDIAFSLSAENDRFVQQEPIGAKLTVDLLGALRATLNLDLTELNLKREDSDLELEAELSLGWPADHFNALNPCSWLSFVSPIPLRLRATSSGSVTFQLRGLPFSLALAGCRIDAEEEQFFLNFGPYGEFSLAFPLFTCQADSLSASGTLNILALPGVATSMFTAALRHLKLDGIAALLPALLTPDSEASMPTRLDYRIDCIPGAGATLHCQLPKADPVVLAWSGDSASIRARLYAVGFGIITDQFQLSFDTDLELAVPSSDLALPDPLPVPLEQTHCSLHIEQLVLCFCGNPSVGYVPIPLFCTRLDCARYGAEGMQLGFSAAVPIPELAVAAPLIRALQSYLSQADGTLDAAVLQAAGLSFSLGDLRLHQLAPAPSFGFEGNLIESEGSQLVPLFEALKQPELGLFLDLLPTGKEVGGEAFALFALNAELSWALMVADSFRKGLLDPLAFTQAAAQWQLPRPLDTLVVHMFGSAVASVAPTLPELPTASAPPAAAAATPSASPLAAPTATPSTAEVEVPDEVFAHGGL